MSTTKTLHEKGNASFVGFGDATVVVDDNGNRLNMVPVRMENGTLGGAITQVKAGTLDPRRKRAHIVDTDLHEISVSIREDLVYIQIVSHWADSLEERTYETAGQIQGGELTLFSDPALLRNEGANELATGDFQEAVVAALYRASLPRPRRLFYGEISPDMKSQAKAHAKAHVEACA